MHGVHVKSYEDAYKGYRFSFHHAIKLSHLVFVDDVILYCKGDSPSTYLMLQDFRFFSNILGLRINEMPFEFYFAVRDQQTIQRVKDVSGFRHSQLPFRYLGVFLFSKEGYYG